MAGEIIKTRAICLTIRPWSRTSHITTWLTPSGCITTVVKGAVRPKSAFLGQYDLNYLCEILYYARAKGELHALRECVPLSRRDALRSDFRALVLADWFRQLALNITPAGPDAVAWFELLETSLDGLNALANNTESPAVRYLRCLLVYEMTVLRLTGLTPEFGDKDGIFHLHGERNIPVSPEIIACLKSPKDEKNLKIMIDTIRVIGVFYTLHLDCAPDVRRTVLRMISQ